MSRAGFQPLLVPLVGHSCFGPTHKLYCDSSDGQKETTLKSGQWIRSRLRQTKMRNIVKPFEFGFGWDYWIYVRILVTPNEVLKIHIQDNEEIML